MDSDRTAIYTHQYFLSVVLYPHVVTYDRREDFDFWSNTFSH